jgi:hypothetical protein
MGLNGADCAVAWQEGQRLHLRVPRRRGPWLWAPAHNDHTPPAAPVGVTVGVWTGSPGAEPRESSGRQDVAVPREVVENPAGASDHGGERIVVHPDRQAGLVHQELVEAAD